MCGITGFFVNGPRAGCDGVLRRMTASLRHRGPDDEGAYIDSHMALGVRRLSVTDLETGRQPISNEDHTVHVVLNGEIYNFTELRKRLEGRGHTFRTQSDAEVIVHAYEEAGDAVVTELDGMFAFALWDPPRRRLLLPPHRMRRLVSDVPLGAFLSGGIDSGTVVALAAAATSPRPFRTFSVGFEAPGYDERPFADRVAEHCGTTHEAILFSVRDALALMDQVGGLLDEPLVDASFLPRYALARTVRRSVTVALSGDGGDALFCGYPTFLADRPARWLRRWLPAAGLRGLGALVNGLPSSSHYGSVDFLLKQSVRALPYAPAVRTQLLLGGLVPADQAELLTPAARQALAAFDAYEELVGTIEQTGLRDPMERLIYQHARFYLGDQTLVAVDPATMAAGLAGRAPLLDHRLRVVAGRIPARLELRGWTTKRNLKRAAAGLLPATTITRRKQGLSVPLPNWLRGPLR